MLGVLLLCFSQQDFLVNNSVLCLYENYPLGESPSKFVHTCLLMVFIFLFHGPWPSGCWPQREKNCTVPFRKEFTVWESKVTAVGWKTAYWALIGQGHHRKSLEDSMGDWILRQLANGVLPVLTPGEGGNRRFYGMEHSDGGNCLMQKHEVKHHAREKLGSVNPKFLGNSQETSQ